MLDHYLRHLESQRPGGGTPRRSAGASEHTITADPPSEICEALPAVMLPSLSKAGGDIAAAFLSCNFSTFAKLQEGAFATGNLGSSG